MDHISMLSIEKFESLCCEHAAMELAALKTGFGQKEIRRENAIISRIKREGSRLIGDGVPIDELLDHEMEAVQFWSAACCIEDEFRVKDALATMSQIASTSSILSYGGKAVLIVEYFKES